VNDRSRRATFDSLVPGPRRRICGSLSSVSSCWARQAALAERLSLSDECGWDLPRSDADQRPGLQRRRETDRGRPERDGQLGVRSTDLLGVRRGVPRRRYRPGGGCDENRAGRLPSERLQEVETSSSNTTRDTTATASRAARRPSSTCGTVGRSPSHGTARSPGRVGAPWQGVLVRPSVRESRPGERLDAHERHRPPAERYRPALGPGLLTLAGIAAPVTERLWRRSRFGGFGSTLVRPEPQTLSGIGGTRNAHRRLV
jgi:hypothetical protein